MTRLSALLATSTLLLSVAAADDAPLLAIPGEALFQSAFDAPLGDSWKAAKGEWIIADGSLKGSELEADKHGAVNRYTTQLTDFIIEAEFKLDGARAISLSINAVKDHMARIAITPASITFRRDDNDHEGPDKAVTFAVFPHELELGTWHKVRLEMVGDAMLGQVNDLTAWGADELFTTPKANPGFTVAGQSASFRNLSIRAATLNPKWDEVKAALPEPGSLRPAPKGKAKAKAKAAAKE